MKEALGFSKKELKEIKEEALKMDNELTGERTAYLFKIVKEKLSEETEPKLPLDKL